MLFVYVFLPCVFPRYSCLYPRLEDLSAFVVSGWTCENCLFVFANMIKIFLVNFFTQFPFIISQLPNISVKRIFLEALDA